MSIKVRLKHSSTLNKAPLPADLDSGELALNINENSPAAYIKDSNGSIVKLAGAGAIGDDWTRTGTVLSPATAGDVVNISAGTAALPGLTPVGDPDSGLYSAGADQIGIATKGTQRISIAADGDINIDNGGLFYDATNNRLAIGTTSPGYVLDVNGTISTSSTIRAASTGTFTVFPAGVSGIWTGSGFALTSEAITAPIGFLQGATERARIDDSKLLVGTSSAVQTDSNSLIQAASPTGGYYITGRNDSSIIAGNAIGGMRFYGNASDGNYDECARIECIADGTHIDASKPSRLEFSVTADGADSPTQRMAIKASGIINFSNVPVYADNAAALAGGRVAGDIYRKADGTLMITT